MARLSDLITFLIDIRKYRAQRILQQTQLTTIHEDIRSKTRQLILFTIFIKSYTVTRRSFLEMNVEQVLLSTINKLRFT